MKNEQASTPCVDCSTAVTIPSETRLVTLTPEGKMVQGPVEPYKPKGDVRCYECGRDRHLGESA